MHVIAAETMLRMADQGAPPAKVVTAARRLHQDCLRMIEGQYLDLEQEARLDTTPAEYFEIVAKKTGALIECSAYLGAFFGTDDPDMIDRLSTFGRWIGRAFQIRDDVLGIWGSAEVLGKSTQSDIRRKKKSLPVVYALARATGTDRDVLHRIYGLPELSDAQVQAVLTVLDRVGARAYADGLTAEAHERALAALAGLPLEAGIAGRLRELAEFLGGREY